MLRSAIVVSRIYPAWEALAGVFMPRRADSVLFRVAFGESDRAGVVERFEVDNRGFECGAVGLEVGEGVAGGRVGGTAPSLALAFAQCVTNWLRVGM